MNNTTASSLDTSALSYAPCTSIEQRVNTGSTSFQNETEDSNSSYDSALESVTSYSNFDEGLNNNRSGESSNNKSNLNSTTDYESTLNGTDLLNTSVSNVNDNTKSNINGSLYSIQSESTDTNTSQEEVDPKSQLALKTIFKSDNPNLSIIEISQTSIQKEEEQENFVVLIDPLSEQDKEAKGISQKQKKSPIKNDIKVDEATEKRSKRTDSLIQSRKQKLNIEIAEASAAESMIAEMHKNGDKTQKNGILKAKNDLPETKREIKLYESEEEFENNLPSTVTVLNTPFGSKVYLVGTAHFSEESQDDVSFVIRNVRPDVVMVELCPSRIHILKLDEKTLLEEAKNINLAKIRSIIQANGYINGIFFILLLQMSAQIAKDLGMAPGGEFRRAFEEIHRLSRCVLHLGDRPIRVTLHRALRALTLWQTMKMVWRLTSSDSFSIEEVEECKQRDLLEKIMQDMAGEFPAFSDVFVKERDLFLCHSLQISALPTTDSNGRQQPVRVVGVVGIGHARGIAQMWGRVDPQIIPTLMKIPPASLSTRICKYTFKYGLAALTLYGAFKIIRPRLGRLF